MNILFISQLYPIGEDSKSTFALHYFTKEWSKNHHVKVIRPLYPYEEDKATNGLKIALDNVEIEIIKPIWFPIIKKSYINKKKILESIDFEPDIIICHKNTAYLPFYFLKKHFGVPMIVGIHRTDILFSKTWLYRRRQEKVFEDVDLFAFRSKALKKHFLERFSQFKDKKSFIANSGVPQNIILKRKKNNNTGVKKIIFVGALIDSKNLDKLLISLTNVKTPYQLTVIGDGENKEKLLNLCKTLNIERNVFFLGRIKREKVFLEMEKHDFFVMPGIKETLGLVYLEAMAKGLVVVGMKGWGIDGIIHDGENGFLCENDSQEKVNDKIIQVLNLTAEEQKRITANSFKTIEKYTEQSVADEYLKEIEDLF